MKRWAALGALASLLVLAGCTSEPPGPTFEEACADRGGVVLTDSTTELMSGTVTGTVVGSNGGVGTGTGFVTSPVEFTMSLCVVQGDVVEMDVS